MQPDIEAISQPQTILPLLAACDLPTDDIGALSTASFFALRRQATLLGVIGLEHHGSTALLRSLAVAQQQRGQGLGGRLLAFAEQQAHAAGATSVYLLTTTAADYFMRHGYRPADRASAPQAIRDTAQFSSLCPATAQLLRKTLSG